MAETTQYTFDLAEVATKLVKAQGLHEGFWTLGFEITVTVGTFGTSPSDAKPGAMMQVAKVHIRQSDAQPDVPYVVDAATVNPRPKGKQERPSRSRSTEATASRKVKR